MIDISCTVFFVIVLSLKNDNGINQKSKLKAKYCPSFWQFFMKWILLFKLEMAPAYLPVVRYVIYNICNEYCVSNKWFAWKKHTCSWFPYHKYANDSTFENKPLAKVLNSCIVRIIFHIFFLKYISLCRSIVGHVYLSHNEEFIATKNPFYCKHETWHILHVGEIMLRCLYIYTCHILFKNVLEGKLHLLPNNWNFLLNKMLHWLPCGISGLSVAFILHVFFLSFAWGGWFSARHI